MSSRFYDIDPSLKNYWRGVILFGRNVASPEKQIELARLAALDGKTWNPHTLVGEYLLVRNHREAACYKLPVTGTPKQK